MALYLGVLFVAEGLPPPLSVPVPLPFPVFFIQRFLTRETGPTTKFGGEVNE